MTNLRRHAALAQALHDFNPCSVEPGLYGPNRPTNGLGDLFIRQPALVKQEEDLAVFRSQLFNGQADLAEQFVGIAGTAVGDGLVEVTDRLRTPPSPGQASPAAVDGNSHYPRPQGPVSVPAFQAAKYTKEHILGNVFGLVSVAQQANAQAVHVSLEAFHQCPQSLGVALQT